MAAAVAAMGCGRPKVHAEAVDSPAASVQEVTTQCGPTWRYDVVRGERHVTMDTPAASDGIIVDAAASVVMAQLGVTLEIHNQDRTPLVLSALGMSISDATGEPLPSLDAQLKPTPLRVACAGKTSMTLGKNETCEIHVELHAAPDPTKLRTLHLHYAAHRNGRPLSIDVDFEIHR